MLRQWRPWTGRWLAVTARPCTRAAGHEWRREPPGTEGPGTRGRAGPRGCPGLGGGSLSRSTLVLGPPGDSDCRRLGTQRSTQKCLNSLMKLMNLKSGYTTTCLSAARTDSVTSDRRFPCDCTGRRLRLQRVGWRRSKARSQFRFRRRIYRTGGLQHEEPQPVPSNLPRRRDGELCVACHHNPSRLILVRRFESRFEVGCDMLRASERQKRRRWTGGL